MPPSRSVIFGQDLQDLIHILIRVKFIEAQAQAPVGYLVGKVDGQQDMRGVEGTGGTRRSRRGADPFKIEVEQDALAFYALEAAIEGIEEPFFRMSVDILPRGCVPGSPAPAYP